MHKKRTDIDFSKHEVLLIDTPGLLVHHLKKPDTVIDNIKYINTQGIMAVTGDYGNWIFCREFHPDAKNGVSDQYWCEKLKMASTQEPYEFDVEGTKQALEQKIEEYIKILEESGKDEDQSILEFYQECFDKCEEGELDYTHFVYRERPSALDYDDVIFVKDYKYWLKAVFDGFDEICTRMKEVQVKKIEYEIDFNGNRVK